MVNSDSKWWNSRFCWFEQNFQVSWKFPKNLYSLNLCSSTFWRSPRDFELGRVDCIYFSSFGIRTSSENGWRCAFFKGFPQNASGVPGGALRKWNNSSRINGQAREDVWRPIKVLIMRGMTMVDALEIGESLGSSWTKSMYDEAEASRVKDLDTARKAKSFSPSKFLPLTSR